MPDQDGRRSAAEARKSAAAAGQATRDQAPKDRRTQDQSKS